MSPTVEANTLIIFFLKRGEEDTRQRERDPIRHRKEGLKSLPEIWVEVTEIEEGRKEEMQSRQGWVRYT